MKTQCPACHSEYPIAEAHLGRSAKCKKCGSRFVVRAFDPLDAALAEPFDDSDDFEEIGKEASPPPPSSSAHSSMDTPSESASVPQKVKGRGVPPLLTALLLAVIAVLSIMLWMKQDVIKAMRREHNALLNQITELQSKEKSKKRQNRDAGPTFDFRHTRWGMTKNNVIASQGRLPDQDLSNAVQYDESLIGKKAVITYGFKDGRLIQAQYTIVEAYADPGEYLVVYDGLKVILTKKYGRPAQENVAWRDKTFYEDQSQWGKALVEGHVVFQSQWETKRTTIKAFLGRKDGKMVCFIEYLGKILSPPGGDASDSSSLNIM